jgi:hypothetical protein
MQQHFPVVHIYLSKVRPDIEDREASHFYQMLLLPHHQLFHQLLLNRKHFSLKQFVYDRR